MAKLHSLDQCADCIEAGSTPNGNDYKIAFARALRRNEIDILALDHIEREVRRQWEACRRVRTILYERR